MENNLQTITFNMLPMTIGALPSSYVDSMSYYETLLWLINYLENTIIATVNNNSEVTRELQEKYVELKSYIEHYFDNLDVQEEINNKLDEMVADGTLQEIITSYLNAKAIFCFDTVADMLESTNLIDGSFARTLGYHSANDGGGALYTITETLPSTKYETLESGLYASLCGTALVPEQFGAYGDNTHDDIIPLQAYVTYCATNGLKIRCPKKYKTSLSLIIQNYNNLDIDINYLNFTGGDYAFQVIGCAYCNININELISNYDGVLFEAHRTSYKSIEANNIKIDHITANHNGINLQCNDYAIQYNRFWFNRIQAANICINCDGTDQTGWISENCYYGGRLSGKGNEYSAICINLKNVQTQKFYNVGIEGTTLGIVVDDSKGILIDNPRTLEDIETYAIQLKNTVSRCLFNVNNFYLAELDYSGITAGMSNIFNGSFRDSHTGGNEQYYNSFEIWGDKTMHNCNQKALIYKNARAEATTLTWGSHIKGFPNVIYASTYTVTLDTKFYNTFNINELIFYIGGSTDADYSKIVDESNNVIFDFSAYNSKNLRLRCTNENITGRTHYKWTVEEVTLL